MDPASADPVRLAIRPVQVEQPALPAVPPPAAAQAAATPSEQELQALDAVFAAGAREQSPLPALLGLWSGSMLLHDLIGDHLVRPDDEDEPEPEQPDRPKD